MSLDRPGDARLMLASGLGGGRHELGQAWLMLMMLAWCLGGGQAWLMLMMLAWCLGGSRLELGQAWRCSYDAGLGSWWRTA